MMAEQLVLADAEDPEEIRDNIHDEAESDDSILPLRYDITSFGIDFDVSGLVRRLDEGDIFIPTWQRQYVWRFKQASSFIESLLLGLPVPGVFLGRDAVSGQLYVIDGHQRVRTLQFFYNGIYREPHPSVRSRPFNLEGVDERFEGLSFEGLSDSARRDLNNSLIHATVVRQESPPDNDTSMYQIFKRLNSGGNRVTPQEIRCAVYQGGLIDTIRRLNDNPSWRSIIGRPSPRLKDQELILRFLALLQEGDNYTKPMTEFLNVFTQINRYPSDEWIDNVSQLFCQTIEAFAEAKKRAFRLREGRTVNAAVLDSMTVALAGRIYNSGTPTLSAIAEVHDSLVGNEDYLQAVIQGTSDENSVANRLRIATEAFANA